MTALRGLSVAMLVATAACAFAPRPPESPARTTSWRLAMRRLELSNGLRVVVIRDPKASEIQVTMRYQVGSIDDPPDHPGMAHLVEHLMYQQVLGAKSVFAHLQDSATYFDGVTTFDATTYLARAAPTHLDELLSIEAVRLGLRCTSISDSVFVREREVVLNELRVRDEASEAWALIHAGVYPDNHPYRRPTGGSEQTVGGITRDQACAFADAHYAPKNAVLVISGAVTAGEVEAALAKFIGRVPRREVAPPPVVVPLDDNPRRVEVPAPIDEDILMVTWPMPLDPVEQARMRAVAAAAAAAVDSAVKGLVVPLQLGDGHAPAFAIVVVPANGESFADVLEHTRSALDRAPSMFHHGGVVGELVLNRFKQMSIYTAYASLEDGSDRDTRIASHVLAGRDPSAEIYAELKGLDELTANIAAATTSHDFEWRRATIVTLKASGGKKRGHTAKLAAAIHDQGLRRDPPDPADAHRAATSDTPMRSVDGMRTRQLPNGLKIVLLPLTSTPTLEARLVFAAGTADEPADKRGAAIVAARTLAFDPHHIDDWLRFAASSASDVDVGIDRTTFSARGVDMHLDLLLAGLRRWVRDGIYDNEARRVARALRDAGKTSDDDGAMGDAWRAALYGGAHPYVEAGLLRHASATLTVRDAELFRAAHFTPDNATLVIAGRFDAALADKWIDYLFADWAGRSDPRRSPHPISQPATIAKAEDTALVHFGIAIPATAGDRASRLVAAAMLDEIAGDVRHQLGASYTFSGGLTERRLATSYAMDGSVDARRARDAMELVKTRIDKLRADDLAAARAFVSARARVLSRLGSLAGGAGGLASRATLDIGLERPVMSERQTAVAVQALTIESMAPTLADLDLDRAVMFARGPQPDVDTAFAALGRTPSYIHADPGVDRDVPGPPPADSDDRPITVEALSDSLTDHPPALGVSIAPVYTTARENGQDASGFSVIGEVAYGLTGTTSAGLSLSIGRLDTAYVPQPLAPDNTAPAVMVPIDLDLFVQATAYDRLWGSLFGGLHVERRVEDVVSWHDGIALGMEGGVEILKLGRHRIGLFGRLEGVLVTGYGGFDIGVAYRH